MRYKNITLPMKALSITSLFALLTIFCSAGQFTVTSLNNTGVGSLRQGLVSATSGDTIVFDAALSGTIELDSALIINKDIVIWGPGADVITISGKGASRCLFYSDILALGHNVSISGLKFYDGYSNTGAGAAVFTTFASVSEFEDCVFDSSNCTSSGGAIYVQGAMTLKNCDITNNTAIGGGGGIQIFNGTSLTVLDCNISNNEGADGGGILAINSLVSIRNSSISNNIGNSSGAAVCVENTSLTIVNSTISGNLLNPGGMFRGSAIFDNNLSGTHDLIFSHVTFADNSGVDSLLSLNNAMVSTTINLTIGNCIFDNLVPGYDATNFGTINIVSDGSNICADGSLAAILVGPNDMNNTDPMLDALADNGGPTKTHALLAGSPAIDQAQLAYAEMADQRSYFREGLPDIGAYEYDGYAQPTHIIINEIDGYTGVTDETFIELYDFGVGNTSLDGMTIGLSQGATSLINDTINLAGYQTDTDGYFVIGNAGVANVDLVIPAGTLQPQSNAVVLYSRETSYFSSLPAAIDLYNIIDAAVHDTGTVMNPAYSVLTAPSDEAHEGAFGHAELYSNQRFPNGSGDARTMLDYTQFRPTPGAENACNAPNAGSDGSKTLCINSGPTNLLTVLSGSPETGWNWTDDDASGGLVGGSIYPASTGTGVFRFTYEVENGYCPSATAIATITVSLCTAIDENAMDNGLAIYPNPAGYQFAIFSKGNLDEINIYSAIGELVFTHNSPGASTVHVDCSTWKTGLYLVQYRTGALVNTSRISKL